MINTTMPNTALAMELAQGAMGGPAGGSGVGGVGGVGQARGTREAGGQSEDFDRMLTQAVQSVEDQSKLADKNLYAVASGESGDLHGMMIQLEQANISLRAMGSVRDKVVEAYQAIWNMPV